MKALRSSSGPTPFARAVQQGLRDRGLGLREFCREVDIDPSFFSKVLAGKRSPPWDDRALRRVAAALRIEAPRLFVAAGRIPAEWERLASDPVLFDRVHSLAAGGGASPRPPRRGGSELGGSTSLQRSQKTFGEELL